MNHRSPSRRHKSHLATAWLAALLQVHLFFILQLHHHRENYDAFAGADQTSAELRFQTLQPGSNPICMACQIARQAAVQPASAKPVRFGAPERPRFVVAPALDHSLISHISLAGRDPPSLS